MSNQTKVVYRDDESGRLITPHEAQNRDPSTWTEERVSVIDPRGYSVRPRRDEPIVEHLDA